MKKSRIKPISDKQELELAKRRGLKYQLWREQAGRCAKCGRYLTYYQAELSHKKPLVRGGKTEAGNCEVLCANWLSGHPEEHGLRQVYNEQPSWRGK